MTEGKDKTVVYRDAQYTLGLQDGEPYLIAGAKTYRLSCHPYEPCLYITGADGRMTVVHNAFDPYAVIETVRSGQTFTSVTGRRYDAGAFCRLVASCAGAGELSIDAAERVLREPKGNLSAEVSAPVPSVFSRPPHPPRGCRIVTDDPFCALIAFYPDSAVDWCIVRDSLPYRGRESHRRALDTMCCALWQEPEGGDWLFDTDRAEASPLSVSELFTKRGDGGLTYRRAFLEPPCGCGYTGDDFDRINAALFPAGTDALEICAWTTDWSDYFDEGREWWGALCLTVYDKTCGRTVVITASVTD